MADMAASGTPGGWIGKVTRQLARYGIAGAAVNLALYGVYLILTALGLAPLVAATLVFALGIPLSLRAHRSFTFQVADVPLSRKLLFAAGYVVGYFTQIGTLWALYQGLGLPHQASQLIAMGVVAAVLFLFQKIFVFRA